MISYALYQNYNNKNKMSTPSQTGNSYGTANYGYVCGTTQHMTFNSNGSVHAPQASAQQWVTGNDKNVYYNTGYNPNLDNN